MIEGAETKLGGTKLSGSDSNAFQRRGGRHRIVAPGGSQFVPTSKTAAGQQTGQAHTEAWRWQRMVDEGVYACLNETGDTENILRAT